MECLLPPELLVNLDHSWTPFEIFSTVKGMNKFLEIIATESNRYATHNGSNFETMKEEIMAFLGRNIIMAINSLPAVEGCWSADKSIGNEKI